MSSLDCEVTMIFHYLHKEFICSIKGDTGMNSTVRTHCHDTSPPEEAIPRKNAYAFPLIFSVKNERKILKAILLERLQKLFCEVFHKLIQHNQNNSSIECYTMDSQIIRLLIHSIVETGEYTLEGIAYYTRIPLDIIFEAACGTSNQFSITLWARIAELYLQVRPDIAKMLFDKLLEMKNKNDSELLSLLNES